MSELVETGGVGRSVRRASARPRPADVAEREYLEHRDPVLAMLGAAFPRLRDLEEIYQDAWLELLELESRGESVRSRRALLKTIAWRRAAKVSKKDRRAEPADPGGLVLASVADGRAGPDEEAQRRLDGESLRLVVESLDEREAAVIKLRYECQLSAKEVQAALGISAVRVEKVITKAFKKIAALLEAGESGESVWSRRQRSLLLACELGIASGRQRRRAQDMLDRDPACRALLHAIRSSLDDVAAVLPVPVLLGEQRDRLEKVGRLDELLAGARHLVERVTGRGAPDGTLVEQVGVGGAGAGLAALAVKAAAVCVVVGGAVVCLDGSSNLSEHPAKAAPPPSRHASARVVEPPRDHTTVVRSLQRKKTVEHKASTSHPAAPVSSPKYRSSPLPAPKGSTEFGPGALGSSSVPKQPAAAPQDGGGEFTP